MGQIQGFSNPSINPVNPPPQQPAPQPTTDAYGTPITPEPKIRDPITGGLVDNPAYAQYQQSQQNQQGSGQTSTTPSNYVPPGVSPDTISARNQLNQDSQAFQAAAKNVQDTLTAISNGTTPLTPAEQSQIDGLKASFQTLINQQTLANQGAVGAANVTGFRTGAAIYDKSFANSVGAIVTAGQQKIADLQIKEASAVQQLTESIRNNDAARIKDAWDIYQSAYKDRQAQIQKTIDATQAAFKAEQDRQDKLNQEAQAEKDKVTAAVDSVASDAAKNGAPKSVLDAISKSGSALDAINAAGMYLQQGTGDVGLYLQYKKDALANNQPVQDFTTWEDAKTAKENKQKTAEAYATAFATAAGSAAGKASVESKAGTITTTVQDDKGNKYNVPVSVAPYIQFSDNGVKFADLSNMQGTATEKASIVAEAQKSGIPIILNKNSALDVANIKDAMNKLDTIEQIMSNIDQPNWIARALGGAGLTKLATIAESNPQQAAAGALQSVGLDMLKALSGVQGFRGNATVVQQINDHLPSIYDTNDVVKQKTDFLRQLIGDRETALVGSPAGGDKLVQDTNNAINKLKSFYTTSPTNAKLYQNAVNLAPNATPQEIMQALNIQ